MSTQICYFVGTHNMRESGFIRKSSEREQATWRQRFSRRTHTTMLANARPTKAKADEE